MLTENDVRLIGLTGNAGVGKTVTANAMVRELVSYSRLATCRAFAAPLKEALIQLTGLPPAHFYEQGLKETPIDGLGITPRKMMQLFGTEFVREMVHQDFWLWRMQQTLTEYKAYVVIIDDVRFENEAGFVRDNGGVVVHLRRDYKKSDEVMQHKSEQKLTVHKNDIVLDVVADVETTAHSILKEIKRRSK